LARNLIIFTQVSLNTILSTMNKYHLNSGKVSELDTLLKKRMYRNRLVTIVFPVAALLAFIAIIVVNIYKN